MQSLFTEMPLEQKTKRQVLAQVFVCSGCCCGRTDKGKPNIPLDWLKAEWKKRRLKPVVQLTISGCLGPCDVVNVALIMTDASQTWLCGIECESTYHEILDWATSISASGQVSPLPPTLQPHVFQRFERLSKDERD